MPDRLTVIGWCARARTLLAGAALIVVAPPAARAEDASVARGLRWLKVHKCLSCHSLDGTQRVGPTLAGRWGRPVRVAGRDGAARTVRFDAAYLRRSIETPRAETRQGFPAKAMPAAQISAEELHAVAAALRKVAGRTDAARGKDGSDGGGLLVLILGALLFVGGHLLLSSAPLRSRLIGALGAKGFQGIYSLVAAGGLAAMIYGWIAAPYVELWAPAPAARLVPLLAMPVALVLLVAGFTTPNPTAVAQDQRLAEGAAPRGIVAVTRHPGLWSFALIGASHVPPNGDLATVLLFGSVALLAIAGMFHIDRRRKAADPQGWERFAARTSLVPFAALLAGRVRPSFGAMDGMRVLAGLALYAGLLFAHPYLFGVAVLP